MSIETECAACGFVWEAESQIIDGNFDTNCPECGKGVSINGDGEEIRKRLKKRESINKKIERLASQSSEVDVAGWRCSLEEILDELHILQANINEEIQRRKNQ